MDGPCECPKQLIVQSSTLSSSNAWRFNWSMDSTHIVYTVNLPETYHIWWYYVYIHILYCIMYIHIYIYLYNIYIYTLKLPPSQCDGISIFHYWIFLYFRNAPARRISLQTQHHLCKHSRRKTASVNLASALHLSGQAVDNPYIVSHNYVDCIHII